VGSTRPELEVRMKRILKAVMSCAMAVGVIAAGVTVPGCKSSGSSSSQPSEMTYKCAKPG
jgi:hypothetical protein